MYIETSSSYSYDKVEGERGVEWELRNSKGQLMWVVVLVSGGMRGLSRQSDFDSVTLSYL